MNDRKKVPRAALIKKKSLTCMLKIDACAAAKHKISLS